MTETTALDLITSALVEDGIYADGETISDADAQRGLTIANRMLDSWSNENLICYATLEQSGTLSPGKYQYKIGPTATPPDFTQAQRPIRIRTGPGSAYILDPTGNRYPVDVYTRERWNQIGNISNVTANIPAAIFYDSQFPLGVINVFPVPNIGYVLYWDSYLQLTEFANLAAPLVLPPGYGDAIVSHLKVRFWRPFKSDASPIPPDIALMAEGAKMVLKRANHTETIAVYDKEIAARGYPTYNIYRGA